jgi:hypothetical protein
LFGDIEASQAGRTASRLDRRGQHADRGGLSRTVRSEQSETSPACTSKSTALTASTPPGYVLPNCVTSIIVSLHEWIPKQGRGRFEECDRHISAGNFV